MGEAGSCTGDPTVDTDDLSGDPVLVDAVNGATVNLSGAFTEACGSTHTVSIDWGDGNVSNAIVDETGKTYAGSHTYTGAGVYLVQITITDDQGATSTYMTSQPVLVYSSICGSARIAGNYFDPADGLRTVVSSFARFGSGGSLTSSSDFAFFRRDASNNVVDCFESSVVNVLLLNGNSATIQGEGRFAADGPGSATHTFSITFDDVSDLAVDQDPIQSLDITEIGTGNVAYNLSAPINVQSQRVTVLEIFNPEIQNDDLDGDPILLDFANGSVVNISGTFGIGCGETHTVSIDWGDGNNSNATVDEGTRSYAGSNTYLNTGVYLVEITITDELGGTSKYLASQPVLVYSPSCGSARLNGTYFDAVDGFKTVVSTFAKYGSSTSFTAGSEFVFFRKDGNMTFDRFESTSITTLVISGNSATITGEASASGNGPATHTFTITFQDVTNVKGDVLDPIQSLVVTEMATGTAVYDLAAPVNVQSHRVKVFNTAGCRLGEIVDESILSTSIYPNPFSQSFLVEFSDMPEAAYELRVLNAMGQEVYQTVSDQMKAKISLNHVASGIYFLQVRQGATITTTKLVKE